jgi:hypothetical protein
MKQLKGTGGEGKQRPTKEAPQPAQRSPAKKK